MQRNAGLLEEWAGEEEELLRQIEHRYRVEDGDLLPDTEETDDGWSA
jgi:hypothetical protein